MSKQLLKGTVTFAAAAIVSSLLNFLFYTLGGIIGPEQFGLLVSLLSVLFIVSVAQDIIVQVVAKVVAENQPNILTLKAELKQPLLLIKLVVAAALFILGVLFLRGFLRIESIVPFLILPFVPIVGFGLALNRGVLNGKTKFNYTAITQVVEALGKVVLAFLAVYMGLGINGILLGLVFASVGAHLLANMLVNKLGIEGESVLEKLISRELVISLTLNLLLLNILISLDSVIARNKLDAYAAGIYAGVITFGKLLFFLANSVTLALFPISTSIRSGKKLLFNGLGITIVMGGLTYIGFTFFGEFAVKLIFGEQFLSVASYLGLEALIITLFAMIAQVAAFLMAKSSYKFNYLLIAGIIVQVLMLNFFGNSILEILRIQAFIGGFVLTIGFVYLYGYGFNSKK